MKLVTKLPADLVRRLAGLATTNSEIHGSAHWVRVAEYGRLLANAEGLDRRLQRCVEIFGWVHDLERRRDGEDVSHGERAAAKIETEWRGLLGAHLSAAEIALLARAVRYHSDSLSAAEAVREGLFEDVHIREALIEKVVGCCWDADRLDLLRLGIRPSGRYMSTNSWGLVLPQAEWRNRLSGERPYIEDGSAASVINTPKVEAVVLSEEQFAALKDGWSVPGVENGFLPRWQRVAFAFDAYRLPQAAPVIGDDAWVLDEPIQDDRQLVTIYRKILGEYAAEIRPGDWVTLCRRYAENHGGPEYAGRVVEMRVPAEDVLWAGTDGNEYFYAPKAMARQRDVSLYEHLLAIGVILRPPSIKMAIAL